MSKDTQHSKELSRSNEVPHLSKQNAKAFLQALSNPPPLLSRAKKRHLETLRNNVFYNE